MKGCMFQGWLVVVIRIHKYSAISAFIPRVFSGGNLLRSFGRGPSAEIVQSGVARAHIKGRSGAEWLCWCGRRLHQLLASGPPSNLGSERGMCLSMVFIESAEALRTSGGMTRV